MPRQPADESAQLRKLLEDFLTAQLSALSRPQVGELRRSETGTSRENWAFEARWQTDGHDAGHELLLRRDPAVGVVETGRLAEFQLLDQLSRTSIPAPEVLWLDEHGDQLGRPSVIMRRHAGRAHRAALKETDPLAIGAPGQLGLARDITDLLADLHLLDLDSTGVAAVLGKAPADPAGAELERWVYELGEVELEPQPALRMAIGWMRDHLPPAPPRPVLVHGDYRPGNVLVADGKISALLDWELAHWGDPVDDLGWYSCRVYTGEHFIPGSWTAEDFLARYQARTGIEVEPARLQFWQVMSVFRLTVMALTSVRAFCSGVGDRPARSAGWLVRLVLQSIRPDEER
jgi:aminoglycoside phosphotransferase (APT) family kinase protein